MSTDGSAIALVLGLLVTGCGKSDEPSGVCVSGLTYEGVHYTAYSARVEVEPGAALGHGTVPACHDGNDGATSESVEVRRVGAASPSAAVMLLNYGGNNIYIADGSAPEDLPPGVRGLLDSAEDR